MEIPVSESNEAPNSGRAVLIPQKKHWLGNLFSSPILLAVLTLAAVGLAFKWHAIQKSSDAPILPGWNWSSHPNFLLIYYPNTDCGCGPGLLTALNQAQAEKFDVIAVSNVQGQKLVAATQQVGNLHTTLCGKCESQIYQSIVP